VESYTCENCKEVFIKTWTDEEAMAEMHGEFGVAYEQSDCVVVCDDCYDKVMGKI